MDGNMKIEKVMSKQQNISFMKKKYRNDKYNEQKQNCFNSK